MQYLSKAWLSQLLHLVTVPTIVHFLDQELRVDPVDLVTISPKFFRHFECLKCGRCCGFETSLFFTPIEVQGRGFGYTTKCRMHPICIVVSQESTESSYIYASDWRIGKEPCPYLDHSLCRIHSTKPLQCRLLPIYFDRFKVKGVRGVRLTKRLFNRNWRIKCPMKAEPLTPELLAKDVKLLEQVNEISSYMGLKTHLPAILLRLRSLLDPLHSVWSSQVSKASVVYDKSGQAPILELP